MKLRDILYPNGSPYENVDLLPYDDQNWLGDPISLRNAISTLKPKTVIDLGSWKGASSNFMTKECLKYSDDFEIIAMDTFLGSCEHYTWKENYENNLPRKNNRINLYNVFLSNMIQDNNTEYVTPFQIDSSNGHQILKQWGIVADLIYVDAAHDYLAAKLDIINFRGLLRKGGVMVCDDYDWFPGVKAAADECLPGGNVIGHKYYWINH